MHLTTQREKNISPHMFRHRSSSIFPGPTLLAITDRGTGQVMTLSREGISFGCLYPHVFPKEWKIDILDGRGGHIRQLSVRKIWEMNSYLFDCTKKFDLVVGAEFTDLSEQQAKDLEALLENQVELSPLYRS
ncbi:MAG: hypothetical protein ACWGOX_01475 [Desulforhopalus sp.]